MLVLLALTIFTARYLPLSQPVESITYEKIVSYPQFMRVQQDVLNGEGEDAKANDKIKVSIAGAVVNAGVYELASSAIVADILSAAGGLRKEADKIYVARDLNLAKTLQSGEHFYIPFAAERDLKALVLPPATGNNTSGGSGGNNGGGVAQLVNINTATKEQLQTLTGIGPATADKIIVARPFSKIDDLLNVSGIGPATLEKIKNSITI